jgi:ribosomal protein S8
MEFTTRKELIEDLKNSYEQEGMVLTIKTSKEKRVVLKCDRGEEYVNVLNLIDETHQRDTHTRLTGCDFEIVCSSVKGV